MAYACCDTPLTEDGSDAAWRRVVVVIKSTDLMTTVDD